MAPLGKVETSDQVAPLSAERRAGYLVPSQCTKVHSRTLPSVFVAMGPGASLARAGWAAKGAQDLPPSADQAPLPWSPQPVRTTYDGRSAACASPVTVPNTGFVAMPRDGEAVSRSWYITPTSPRPLIRCACPVGGEISCRTEVSSRPRICGAQCLRSRVP